MLNTKLIRTAILCQGKTIGEFAEGIGLSPSGLSKILNTGRCRPSSLRKIAKGMNLNPIDIILQQEMKG